MKYYTFDCGCKFKLLDDNEDKEIPSIDFSLSLEDLNLDCKKTWDIISSGNTKGCFQLESRLGRSMAKKLRPENIEQLSALISIMRPGCLEAMRDNKSVSNHFIDKKNGQESIDYFDPCLESVLKPTYGEMIYQEQAMEIARIIAGFDLQEADVLRKAIGKKKVDLMAKVKKSFLKGAKKTGITSIENATDIFGWIEKSQRYSFNKSHAISYAYNAYLSAYSKAHFPKIFFASYLKYAKDKIDPQQEVRELVQNATEMDIEITVPDLLLMNQNFCISNEKIYFGLTDIKNVGLSVYKKLIKLNEDYPIKDLCWTQCLFMILDNITSTAAKALASCGALDIYNKSRTSMLFEYEIILELTKKEKEYICGIDLEDFDLLGILNILLKKPRLNVNRKAIINNLIKSIENPPYSLDDKIEWMCDTENDLLGINLTYCKLDSYNISNVNTQCRDLKGLQPGAKVMMAAEIESFNIVKIKKGPNKGSDMCFVTARDSTGCCDSVIFFTEQLTLYRNELFEGNIVIIQGKTSKNGGLVVDKIYKPRG